MNQPIELEAILKVDDSDSFRRMLAQGLPVNSPISWNRDFRPATLLQQAASLGAVRIIHALLANGADVEYKKWYGSPLSCAVRCLHVRAAKLLLTMGADPNTSGPSPVEGDGNWTPLMDAAFKNNSDLIDLLFEYGADPKRLSRRGLGILDCAAYNQNLELAELAIGAGTLATGHALLCAVERGSTTFVELLLKTNCDPNYLATKTELADVPEGQTPLSLAIQKLSVSKILRNLRAAMGGEGDVEPRLRQIIGLLLNFGSDPNRRVGNRTPLSQAVWDRDQELVRQLLIFGADPSGISYSPFMEFKKHKGDSLGFYETALHTAVRNGPAYIVKHLLKAGANPGAVDHNGVSVIELASQSSDPEMLAVINEVAGKSNDRRTS